MRALLPILVLAAALAVGCRSERRPTRAADAGPEPAPVVAQRALSTLLAGTSGAPALPDVVAGLALGVSRTEALQLLPALADGTTLKPPELAGLWFQVVLDPAGERVLAVHHNLPREQAEELAIAAWGEPARVDLRGRRGLRWENRGACLTVTLTDGLGEDAVLRYDGCELD